VAHGVESTHASRAHAAPACVHGQAGCCACRRWACCHAFHARHTQPQRPQRAPAGSRPSQCTLQPLAAHTGRRASCRRRSLVAWSASRASRAARSCSPSCVSSRTCARARRARAQAPRAMSTAHRPLPHACSTQWNGRPGTGIKSFPHTCTYAGWPNSQQVCRRAPHLKFAHCPTAP